jgi:hypothetical protein
MNSKKVKRSRLYEIARYLRGLDYSADASHVENCARELVSLRAEVERLRGGDVAAWRDLVIGEEKKIGDRFMSADGHWVLIRAEHLGFEDYVSSATRPMQRRVAHPAPAVPDCPYPCGWKKLNRVATEKAAYFARASMDDGVPESVRDAGIDLGNYAVSVIRKMLSADPQQDRGN